MMSRTQLSKHILHKDIELKLEEVGQVFSKSNTLILNRKKSQAHKCFYIGFLIFVATFINMDNSPLQFHHLFLENTTASLLVGTTDLRIDTMLDRMTGSAVDRDAK